MKIKNLEINGIASLAPMAGITDKAMREICKIHGAAYFTSEMVSTKGIVYGSTKTIELTAHSELEYPFAIQLFGNDPKDFKKAIEMLGEHPAEIIDINMGCPATKIVKENSGSALMKNPELCAEIVYASVSASNLPVTVKIRSGWDSNSINACEVAKMCEQAGASAITIHGRTKSQGYSGISDQNIIKAVKESVKVPVIGNGDIKSAEDAAKMMDFTGCDMVAIGRGAMGNPWIFKEINAYFNGESYTPPTLEEKIKTMQLHMSKICEYKGEKRGIQEAKKLLVCYIKDFYRASEFRRRIFDAQSLDDISKIFKDLINS